MQSWWGVVCRTEERRWRVADVIQDLDVDCSWDGGIH